jgi:hypothetical protein
MASRIRKENFRLAGNGKNKAQSFYMTKERKASRNISKLVKENGQEINKPAEIVQELQDRFCDTVGQAFEPSATLENWRSRRVGSQAPLLFHQEGGWTPVPILHKFMQGHKNILKINIQSKTNSNNCLVMNRKIWTNQKRYLSTTSSETRQALYVHYVARLRTPCTSCSSVHGDLNLMGTGCGGNYCLDKACLPDSTNILDTFMVQYTTLMMVRSYSGMLQIMAWFHVIKRDLIYRRFKRCTARAIQPDWTRLLRYFMRILAIQLSGTKCRSCRDYFIQLLLQIKFIGLCRFPHSPPTAISGTILTLTHTQPIAPIGAIKSFAQDKCTHHNS